MTWKSLSLNISVAFLPTELLPGHSQLDFLVVKLVKTLLQLAWVFSAVGLVYGPVQGMKTGSEDPTRLV
jgi:hypothetical protein